MCAKVSHISCIIEMLIMFSVIEHILASDYYSINERYPLSVRKYHSPRNKIDAKRSATHDIAHVLQKYNDSTVDEEHRHENQKKMKKRGNCVKCPGEITAIARRNLDGVLLELPAPLSCKTRLPFASNLYRIETLFGPELPFLLPQGIHSLFAKIRNIETGLIVKSCQLRYNVIVRRCQGYPELKDKNVKMSCTSGTIWGSHCAFECKNRTETLSHHEAVVCNEDLEWIGDAPECTSQIENTLNDNDNGFCALPEPPANGRYVCDAKNHEIPEIQSNQIEMYKTLAPDSTCHVRCKRTYSIPYHLLPFSKIACANGSWNTTDIEFCYKKQSQQRRSSGRHQIT